jgi:hypothetical protein
MQPAWSPARAGFLAGVEETEIGVALATGPRIGARRGSVMVRQRRPSSKVKVQRAWFRAERGEEETSFRARSGADGAEGTDRLMLDGVADMEISKNEGFSVLGVWRSRRGETQL